MFFWTQIKFFYQLACFILKQSLKYYQYHLAIYPKRDALTIKAEYPLEDSVLIILLLLSQALSEEVRNNAILQMGKGQCNEVK